MNDSTDLRNRILKMRENNDFILSSVKPEQLKEDVETKIKSDEVIKVNTEKFNSSNEKETLAEDENAINSPSPSHTKNNNSNNKNYINLVDTNEAQFRILASKFNEAVEVILELSDKVKKLEHIIFKNQKDFKKRNVIFDYINIKILFSMIFIPLLILGVFTLPFDFDTFKLIFSDILSSM